MMDGEARTTSAADNEELATIVPRKAGGMNKTEAEYMRGDRHPIAQSIPLSTSKYLNSPLFAHAYTQKALRRYGNDISSTYDIPDMSRALADVADYAAGQKAIDAEKAKNPAFKAWIEKRQFSNYDPAEMEHYAPGTLGHAIREFIVSSGMKLDFVNSDWVPKNDIEYLMKRFGGSHDIQHIVTGFGPNPAGEQALAIMCINSHARGFSPELAHFISTSLFFVSGAAYTRGLFNYPEGTPILMEAMEMGLRAGRLMKQPMVMVEWEKYLDWQLDDIATDLGFERGPAEAWDYTVDTCLG